MTFFSQLLKKCSIICSVTSRQWNTQIQDILSNYCEDVPKTVKTILHSSSHWEWFPPLPMCFSFNVILEFSFLTTFHDFLLILTLLNSPQLLCLYFLIWNTNLDVKFYFLQDSVYWTSLSKILQVNLFHCKEEKHLSSDLWNRDIWKYISENNFVQRIKSLSKTSHTGLAVVTILWWRMV